MKKALFVAIAVATLAILPATAQAVPIAGDINIAGKVTVDATTIDWLELGSIFGDNEFLVIDGTGYFTGLTALPVGDALDLDSTLFPVNTAISLPNFLTFDADPGLSFELTLIAGCDPSACLFAGTPFNAYDTSSGGILRTTVELALGGRVTDSDNPGAVSNWIGTWSADFINVSVADLQAAFAPNGPGFITAPYSADITVTVNPPTEVPEPATLLTFGAGTALLAAHRRRRSKKAAQQ